MSDISFEHLRFLVADNHENMRKIVRTMLRAFGADHIAEAEDGVQALEMIEAFAPDILITDIFMPLFDGVQLARMIRQPQFTDPYIPIIVITANPQNAIIKDALDAGVDFILTKPFSSRDMYTRIERLVTKPRKFVSNSSYFGPRREAVKTAEKLSNSAEIIHEADDPTKFVIDL